MYQAPFERIDHWVEHALDIHWRIANPQMLASLTSMTSSSNEAAMVASWTIDACAVAC